MKKLLVFLIVMVCLLGLGSVAFGNSGSAVIPFVFCNNLHPDRSIIYITNITNEPIDVKVSFFNSDGVLFIDGDNNPENGKIRLSGSIVTNYNDNPVGSSASFTLNAHSSIAIGPYTSTPFIGYGTIEWSQNSQAVCGLIAFSRGQQYAGGNWGYWSIPINEGQPF